MVTTSLKFLCETIKIQFMQTSLNYSTIYPMPNRKPVYSIDYTVGYKKAINI